VDTGLAALVADPHRPGGWTLLVDGVEQSYVDLHDATYLRFDYVRRIAAVLDAAAPAGAPVHALHLGGGGLTLPRYLAATRAGSHQVVVERDAALVDLVRRALPPPAGLSIRTADARLALADEPDDAYDVVLADVYRGARMPPHVATADFAAEVARVLRPDGVYLVNLTDLPPLVGTRVQVATLRTAFAEVCLVAARTMLRGRRYGNVVLAAARRPGRLPLGPVAAAVARDQVPGRLLHGPELDVFVAGARPARDPHRPGD
jgi:spermidine synthase